MNSTDGINNESQQRFNRALIIDLLRKEGICSRAKLARLSNLKRATISNIINEFISCGLVVETGFLSSPNNRRSIGIRINGNNFRVIGVMLNRKQYFLISMGLSGEIYKIINYPLLEAENINKVIMQIEDSINVMIAGAKETEILAIGVALPGPYKREKGEIVFVSNFTEWGNVHIQKKLQEAFSIPVFIENDANAGVYSLLWHNREYLKYKSIVYILAGQGIGCGVIMDDNIMIGEKGLAGEIGHTSIDIINGTQCECGNKGCLENYCSTIALEKRLLSCIKNNEKTILNDNFNWENVVIAVNSGDEIAVREYRDVCMYLAAGIVNVINQLNPGVVIIGDQLSGVHPEIMYEVVHEYIHTRIRPLMIDNLKIEIDKSDINPVLTGAAVIAAQKVLENPFAYIKKNEPLDNNNAED